MSYNLTVWEYLIFCCSGCLTLWQSESIWNSTVLNVWHSDTLTLWEHLRTCCSDSLTVWKCLKTSDNIWVSENIWWSTVLTVWWSDCLRKSGGLLIWESEIFWKLLISDIFRLSDHQMFRSADPQFFSVHQIYVSDIRFSQTFRTFVKLLMSPSQIHLIKYMIKLYLII